MSPAADWSSKHVERDAPGLVATDCGACEKGECPAKLDAVAAAESIETTQIA